MAHESATPGNHKKSSTVLRRLAPEGQREVRKVLDAGPVFPDALGQRPLVTNTTKSSMIPSPQLSIVVPTFNERGNVAELVGRLRRILAGTSWEVIFVDDNSPDGTGAEVREIAAADTRVRCLRRVGRRGLAGACIEGMLASSAPVVAVMDADLQHDEAVLPAMLAAIGNGADVAVGTRYSAGGDTGAGLSAYREGASRLATTLARTLLGVTISDPMSGFFMLRREIVEAAAPKLSEQGFKILLDILASTKSAPKIVELPYTFRERHSGQSKLDSLVAIEYLGLLLSKVVGDWLSVRFLLFVLVGASGLLVHLAALRLGIGAGQLGFGAAQGVATIAAMTWNFFANNQLTYRDRRLTGLAALRGLLMFYAVCSIGAFANVGVAGWLYEGHSSWWLAGTAGALMGAVFNYAASSALTWRRA